LEARFFGGFIFIKIIWQTNLSKMDECQIPATKKNAIATAMLRASKIPHEITRGVVSITMKQ